jgi:hypothetical protein
MATNKLRGSNAQRHQQPYRDNLNLTDRPVGYGPYRGDGSMDVLDTDVAGSAEGGNRAPTRAGQSNAAKSKQFDKA